MAGASSIAEPDVIRDDRRERWDSHDDGRAAGLRWWSAEQPTRQAGEAEALSRTMTRGRYEEPPPAPPPPAPTSEGPDMDELERLGELHANGTLTDEEFAAAKANILGT